MLYNHPRPACPICANPRPDRNGTDYTYEKQKYRCKACAHTFHIKLNRFAPIEIMDGLLDEAIRFASDFSRDLLAAGVFHAFAARPEQADAAAHRFAALLAGEIYLSRIGQADHYAIEDAATTAVAALNKALLQEHPCRSSSDPTPRIALAPVLSALQVPPIPDLTPIYSLDRTQAAQGLVTGPGKTSQTTDQT